MSGNSGTIIEIDLLRWYSAILKCIRFQKQVYANFMQQIILHALLTDIHCSLGEKFDILV